MASLRVRISEGSTAQPILLWDSVWQPALGYADWSLAGDDEPQNRGGLRSKAALHSAIVQMLFTDRRMPENHPLQRFVADADPRGWWGDGVDVRDDLFETDLGSLLWVFERSILTEEVRRWVEAITLEALSPLIRQGAAMRIDAQATSQQAFNRCDIAVQVYGRDGTRAYNHRFEDIWRQTAG